MLISICRYRRCSEADDDASAKIIRDAGSDDRDMPLAKRLFCFNGLFYFRRILSPRVDDNAFSLSSFRLPRFRCGFISIFFRLMPRNSSVQMLLIRHSTETGGGH